MLLVGNFPKRFLVALNEQFFRRINLEAASRNGVSQFFLLTVNRIVPMRYQLDLICIKDEHLNM